MRKSKYINRNAKKTELIQKTDDIWWETIVKMKTSENINWN